MKRQTIHVKAPDNWVNDPNGFIYYKGWYHLFYQYFPYAPRWGTMHWGHAVSRDLVHWEHQKIALFPTKRADQNGCFSGSAVEKDGRLYLAYTGVRYEKFNPEDIHECLEGHFESSQLMITSEDGFQFDNWKDKRVIIPPVTEEQIGHRTHTRDPKMWRGEDAWYLIVGSTYQEKEGKVLFYRSQDLEHWTLVNQSSKGPGYGWMWECPDYFKAGEEEVLLVSAIGLLQEGEGEQNHSICFPVRFEEKSCRMDIADAYQFLDYGLDLYAPQTTLDEEGRRILTAWLRMPEAVDDTWIGMFCAPRVVEVKNGHVYFRMHPKIREAFSREILEKREAGPSGCLVSFELEDGEELSIGGFLIGRKGQEIYTDRRGVFPQRKGARMVSRTPEVKEGFRLEVLVDVNMIEVYINDGEYVISNAVYGLEMEISGKLSGKVRILAVEEETV